MNVPPEYIDLPREDLIAIILDLKRQVRVLEEKLAKSQRPSRMPGTKPEEAPAQTEEKQRSARKHSFVRRRSEPTETIAHKPEQCPDCGTTLAGGWVQRTREVIELVLTKPSVTAHQLWARRCPVCEKRVIATPNLGAVVRGKQRLGVGLTSVVAYLRETLSLPVDRIVELLRTCFGVELSAGAVVACIQRVAEAGKSAVEALREAIRLSPVVHADETGWRENGKNGYIWSISTPDARAFSYGKRDTAAFHAALGEGFAGVLVSDFYAVYAQDAGTHQWCWAHLLRDLHDLRTLWPEDGHLAAWVTAVKAVYDRARETPLPPLWERGTVMRSFQWELERLCEPVADDDRGPQARLARRMLKHSGGLFTFVGTPGVPADNNAAERSLRHLVTSRKVSGGSRSSNGTEAKMTLASLFGTYRLRGINPITACRALLISPQP